MADVSDLTPDDDPRADQERLEKWLRLFGYAHGEDWNHDGLPGQDPTLDRSFHPDRVAIKLLFGLLPPYSEMGEADGASRGLAKFFAKRIYEAESIDENIARIMDPVLVDASILQQRRLAGEMNPKPRVRISAVRTSRGNFSVKVQPFVREPDGRSDLLDRPNSQAPGDWFPGRNWQEVIFLRQFDEFATVFVPYRPLFDNKLMAATAMFAVHLFRYVAGMASKHFDVTFGDVPCLDYNASDPPRLKVVPYAISAAWRRHTEEEYEWRGTCDKDDATYGIDDMSLDARQIVDVISRTEFCDAGEISIIDLLRGHGVQATRRNLQECIGYLRKIAEQPAPPVSAGP